MAILPNHSHCGYCGNPIAYGEEFCDDDCRQLRKAEDKMEKRKDIIFYGAIALSLIAILAAGAILRMLR